MCVRKELFDDRDLGFRLKLHEMLPFRLTLRTLLDSLSRLGHLRLQNPQLRKSPLFRAGIHLGGAAAV